MGKEILEKNLDDLSNDKRKKNITNDSGQDNH
jgi:hypothetical protein